MIFGRIISDSVLRKVVVVPSLDMVRPGILDKGYKRNSGYRED